MHSLIHVYVNPTQRVCASESCFLSCLRSGKLEPFFCTLVILFWKWFEASQLSCTTPPLCPLVSSFLFDWNTTPICWIRGTIRVNEPQILTSGFGQWPTILQVLDSTPPNSFVSLPTQFTDGWLDAACRTYSVSWYLLMFCDPQYMHDWAEGTRKYSGMLLAEGTSLPNQVLDSPWFSRLAANPIFWWIIRYWV